MNSGVASTEYTIPSLLTALSCVFSPSTSSHGHGSSSRPGHDEYLTSFQSSRCAWDVSFDLLKGATTDPTIMFFAAQTLKIKCRGHLHQLALNDVNGIKVKLVSQLQVSPVSNFCFFCFLFLNLHLSRTGATHLADEVSAEFRV